MVRLIFIVILFCSSFCFAELYYWTDNNGVRHFSNTKPDTEAENLETIKEYVDTRKEETGGTIKQKTISIKSPAEQKVGREENYKQNQEVVMYSTQTCGYCRKAKSFFKKYNIKYTEYDVDSSKQAHQKYKALNGDGVPLIYIGNHRISGFDEAAIRNALGL